MFLKKITVFFQFFVFSFQPILRVSSDDTNRLKIEKLTDALREGQNHSLLCECTKKDNSGNNLCNIKSKFDKLLK